MEIAEYNTLFFTATIARYCIAPYNPNHPPITVRDNNGSMRTTDEMFQFIITYLPYEEGDEEIGLE